MDNTLNIYKNLLLQKRYSNNTIKIYTTYFIHFITYFQKYLFEGANGEKNSPTSVANILKKVVQKAGIRKIVISLMLKHSSSKTTEIYTHVSQKSN